MAPLIIYFLVVLTIASGVCYRLYMILRPLGWFRFAAVPVFLLIAVAMVPIPIHGGFTLLGAELLDATDEPDEKLDDDRVASGEAWLAAYDSRLPVPVTIEGRTRLRSGWEAVRLPGPVEALLDTTAGLVWLDVEASGVALESKEELDRVCQGAGPFALPLETEMYYFYQHGGEEALPFTSARYPSLLLLPEFRLETLKWRDFTPKGNRFGEKGSAVIRCVGRLDHVPAEGLLGADISLNEWNEFQLKPMH